MRFVPHIKDDIFLGIHQLPPAPTHSLDRNCKSHPPFKYVLKKKPHTTLYCRHRKNSQVCNSTRTNRIGCSVNNTAVACPVRRYTVYARLVRGAASIDIRSYVRLLIIFDKQTISRIVGQVDVNVWMVWIVWRCRWTSGCCNLSARLLETLYLGRTGPSL